MWWGELASHLIVCPYRSDAEEVIYPADVVLVEGLLLFYFPKVRDMFQMKIFVDTDPDTRLSRRGVSSFEPN